MDLADLGARERVSDPGRRRALGATAILLWMTVLVFGAWPSIVRPAFLDPANELAVDTLRLFGMSAGQPLFQTDASPWKQYGFCFFLREAGRPDAPLLFPPEGECRIDGFHPRLPPVARASHRMLAAAWRQRDGDAASRAGSRAYLEALGRSFCLAGASPEAPRAGVEGLWIWYYRHYDDGSVMRRNGLYFDYSCRDESLDTLLWHPQDAEVLARWGKPPW